MANPFQITNNQLKNNIPDIQTQFSSKESELTAKKTTGFVILFLGITSGVAGGIIFAMVGIGSIPANPLFWGLGAIFVTTFVGFELYNIVVLINYQKLKKDMANLAAVCPGVDAFYQYIKLNQVTDLSSTVALLNPADYKLFLQKLEVMGTDVPGAVLDLITDDTHFSLIPSDDNDLGNAFYLSLFNRYISRVAAGGNFEASCRIFLEQANPRQKAFFIEALTQQGHFDTIYVHLCNCLAMATIHAPGVKDGGKNQSLLETVLQFPEKFVELYIASFINKLTSKPEQDFIQLAYAEDKFALLFSLIDFIKQQTASNEFLENFFIWCVDQLSDIDSSGHGSEAFLFTRNLESDEECMRALPHFINKNDPHTKDCVFKIYSWLDKYQREASQATFWFLDQNYVESGITQKIIRHHIDNKTLPPKSIERHIPQIAEAFNEADALFFITLFNGMDKTKKEHFLTELHKQNHLVAFISVILADNINEEVQDCIKAYPAEFAQALSNLPKEAVDRLVAIFNSLDEAKQKIVVDNLAQTIEGAFQQDNPAHACVAKILLNTKQDINKAIFARFPVLYRTTAFDIAQTDPERSVMLLCHLSKEDKIQIIGGLAPQELYSYLTKIAVLKEPSLLFESLLSDNEDAIVALLDHMALKKELYPEDGIRGTVFKSLVFIEEKIKSYVINYFEAASTSDPASIVNKRILLPFADFFCSIILNNRNAVLYLTSMTKDQFSQFVSRLKVENYTKLTHCIRKAAQADEPFDLKLVVDTLRKDNRFEAVYNNRNPLTGAREKNWAKFLEIANSK